MNVAMDTTTPLDELEKELELLEKEKREVDETPSQNYYEVRKKAETLVERLKSGNFPGINEEGEKRRSRLYSKAHFLEMIRKPHRPQPHPGSDI